MPCLRAKASALVRSRAATAVHTATPVVRAGRSRALGAMRAAPRHPMRTGSTGPILPGPGAGACGGSVGRGGGGLDGRGRRAVGGAHGNAAGPGLLGDGDRDAEHALVALGLDVLAVEGVAQEHLAGQLALGPLRSDDTDALAPAPRALRRPGAPVLLDREVDGGGVDAGDVELEYELFTLAVGVHRHGGRAALGSEDLLG